MTLNWNWTGYGMNSEQIAEARLIEAATAVIGTSLPTPALVHAIIAEIIKGTVTLGAPGGPTFPMEVTLEQFGSYAGGVGDSTVDGPAFTAAMAALAAVGGGTLKLYRHYLTNGQSFKAQGDQFANIKIQAMVPGAGFYKDGTNSPSIGGTDALLTITGSSPYSLKNLTFLGVSFIGNSGTADFCQALRLSNVDSVRFESCVMKHCAKEGLALLGHDSCSNFQVLNNYAEDVGMYTGAYLSAYNVNSDGALVYGNKAISCGQGMEQDGKNCRVLSNHIENCPFAGMLLLSTWASFPLDAGGTNIYQSANVLVSGNMFVNQSKGIQIGDWTGHTDFRFGGAGIVVPGNGGKLLMAFNTFLNCNIAFTGGSDQLNVMVFRGNYMEGAVSADTASVQCNTGRFIVEDNTWVYKGSQWGYLLMFGTGDPAGTFGVCRRNTVIGATQPWTTQAFALGPNVAMGYNDMEQCAAGAGANLYAFYGGSGGTDVLSSWQVSNDTWLVKNDSSFYYSPFQLSTMRVNGSPPAKGTWKAGDVVTNIQGTGASGWRCTQAGTFDTAQTCTISTTNGSTAFTTTAGLGKIAAGQWITIAGVTGSRQILTYQPFSGAGTMSIAADATVTSGAVAFAAGVWTPLASNDAAQLVIAGQTAGDMLVATNATTWARKPAGTNGQYLAMVSGVPTYVTCFPRAANVNISANAFVDFVANADTQQISITNNPVITVRSIPSGGYLVLDVYNATGTANPTWAQSGMGSLITPGGSFPTLTPTINKHDRYAFYNNGTAVVMIVVYVNA